jgi:hypothetical protein
VTGWLLPSTGQKIPVQPGWYLPPQKILLAENRFLLVGKGAKNTKEKFRQCFKCAKLLNLMIRTTSCLLCLPILFFYCTSFFPTWFACAHCSIRLQCTKQEFHSSLDYFTRLTFTILASGVLFFSLLWEFQLVLGYFQSSIILLNFSQSLSKI